MTEGIALPKSDYLNWWQIWMMKNYSKKQTKIIVKLEQKLNLTQKYSRWDKKLEHLIVFAF